MKKYYKILNQNEKHHGLQYKNGLNIDPIPFNPNCVAVLDRNIVTKREAKR